MRKMNTNPTLFASIITGSDEGYWIRGVEQNAIYELRYGPLYNDPEWDYATMLIDTHIWSSTLGCSFEDAYSGYEWPIRVQWSTTDRILRLNGLWEDRVDEISKWKIELWRVA